MTRISRRRFLVQSGMAAASMPIARPTEGALRRRDGPGTELRGMFHVEHFVLAALSVY
ncbi:MAG: twin-arginine translocation signal domain-containing protein [Candidatus Koribacter versatilis]|nr:twin-arginine translocation signal domain-containing protein [Candidatus Koribacter versatilis]